MAKKEKEVKKVEVKQSSSIDLKIAKLQKLIAKLQAKK